METEHNILPVDRYTDEEIADAIKYQKASLEKIFGEDLTQMEYLKLRQIAKEVQADQELLLGQKDEIPPGQEILGRFFRDCYGIDMGANIFDLLGRDWAKYDDYIRSLRQRYLSVESLQNE